MNPMSVLDIGVFVGTQLQTKFKCSTCKMKQVRLVSKTFKVLSCDEKLFKKTANTQMQHKVRIFLIIRHEPNKVFG